jgi:hypothetical protein
VQDVMNLIVVNESDLRRDKVLPKQPLVEDTVRMGWGGVPAGPPACLPACLRMPA